MSGDNNKKLRMVITTNLVAVIAYFIQLGKPSYFTCLPYSKYAYSKPSAIHKMLNQIGYSVTIEIKTFTN